MQLGIQEIGLARKARNLPTCAACGRFVWGRGSKSEADPSARPPPSAGMRAGLLATRRASSLEAIARVLDGGAFARAAIAAAVPKPQ